MSPQEYRIRPRGSVRDSTFRIFFETKDGQLISPWHDIPLHVDGDQQIFNMIVEIPRWSNPKMEIIKTEKYNPIKQDVKKGHLRFLANIFPYKGYLCNYGALPQTWEDPSVADAHTGVNGDDDPLDICEIGRQVGFTGQVKEVKVLGAIGILDEGETDWKIIAIDILDPLAVKLNDITDVETYMPGFLGTLKTWFRIYKVPDGKKKNEVAFGGENKDRRFAFSLIEDCHKTWKHHQNELVERGSELPTDPNGPQTAEDYWTAISRDSDIRDQVEQWHFVDLTS